VRRFLRSLSCVLHISRHGKEVNICNTKVFKKDGAPSDGGASSRDLPDALD
jgi:hypothetical protein